MFVFVTDFAYLRKKNTEADAPCLNNDKLRS